MIKRWVFGAYAINILLLKGVVKVRFRNTADVHLYFSCESIFVVLTGIFRKVINKMAQSCYVIGAGGHGKVIVRLLDLLGFEVTSVLDDDPLLWGSTLLGAPIRGPIDKAVGLSRVPAVLAIGDNRTRHSLAEKFDLDWLTLVHPSAFVDDTAQIGRGSVVLANAVVNVDAEVGDHVIINSAAVVEHDCYVADFAHVAPGSHIAGSVRIEEGVLMGIGSSTNVSVRVGAWSTVGAGAVVNNDVPDSCVAIGVPARSRPFTKD